MPQKLFLTVLLISSCVLHASIVKYKPVSEGAVMAFILLNHDRLVNEIEFGRGDYVQSLGTQVSINIAEMRRLLSQNPDPYQFAKSIIEYK
ncbi:MAG: hypothetical protein QG565_1303 [Campylobacterota bacterium]|nr:hypothetical protein [Campylobacterota bacterium]MDQ1252765.1 hypothetical protein [Euryarchaeota archaeon]